MADRGSDAGHWSVGVHRILSEGGVRQAAYVPDAGLSQLIDRLNDDGQVETTVLTTEEEGVALVAGAWLGGQRAVLLMQSSGVGNCLNMVSLMVNCRFPLLAIVTMRGEWAEFNPWQMPMGAATEKAFDLMGVRVHRVDRSDEIEDAVASGMTMAFDGDQRVAVLLSQRLLGRKTW